jgi:hypothetical protein
LFQYRRLSTSDGTTRGGKQSSCHIICASTSLSFSTYWSKSTNFMTLRHPGVTLKLIRRPSVSEKNTLLSYLLLSPLPFFLFIHFVPLLNSFVSICLSHSLQHMYVQSPFLSPFLPPPLQRESSEKCPSKCAVKRVYQYEYTISRVQLDVTSNPPPLPHQKPDSLNEPAKILHMY